MPNQRVLAILLVALFAGMSALPLVPSNDEPSGEHLLSSPSPDGSMWLGTTTPPSSSAQPFTGNFTTWLNGTNGLKGGTFTANHSQASGVGSGETIAWRTTQFDPTSAGSWVNLTLNGIDTSNANAGWGWIRISAFTENGRCMDRTYLVEWYNAGETWSNICGRIGDTGLERSDATGATELLIRVIAYSPNQWSSIAFNTSVSVGPEPAAATPPTPPTTSPGWDHELGDDSRSYRMVDGHERQTMIGSFANYYDDDYVAINDEGLDRTSRVNLSLTTPAVHGQPSISMIGGNDCFQTRDDPDVDTIRLYLDCFITSPAPYVRFSLNEYSVVEDIQWQVGYVVDRLFPMEGPTGDAGNVHVAPDTVLQGHLGLYDNRDVYHLQTGDGEVVEFALRFDAPTTVQIGTYGVVCNQEARQQYTLGDDLRVRFECLVHRNRDSLQLTFDRVIDFNTPETEVNYTLEHLGSKNAPAHPDFGRAHDAPADLQSQHHSTPDPLGVGVHHGHVGSLMDSADSVLVTVPANSSVVAVLQSNASLSFLGIESSGIYRSPTIDSNLDIIRFSNGNPYDLHHILRISEAQTPPTLSSSPSSTTLDAMRHLFEGHPYTLTVHAPLPIEVIESCGLDWPPLLRAGDRVTYDPTCTDVEGYAALGLGMAETVLTGDLLIAFMPTTPVVLSATQASGAPVTVGGNLHQTLIAEYIQGGVRHGDYPHGGQYASPSADTDGLTDRHVRLHGLDGSEVTVTLEAAPWTSRTMNDDPLHVNGEGSEQASIGGHSMFGRDAVDRATVTYTTGHWYEFEVRPQAGVDVEMWGWWSAGGGLQGSVWSGCLDEYTPGSTSTAYADERNISFDILGTWGQGSYALDVRELGVCKDEYTSLEFESFDLMAGRTSLVHTSNVGYANDTTLRFRSMSGERTTLPILEQALVNGDQIVHVVEVPNTLAEREGTLLLLHKGVVVDWAETVVADNVSAVLSMVRGDNIVWATKTSATMGLQVQCHEGVNEGAWRLHGLTVTQRNASGEVTELPASLSATEGVGSALVDVTVESVLPWGGSMSLDVSMDGGSACNRSLSTTMPLGKASRGTITVDSLHAIERTTPNDVEGQYDWWYVDIPWADDNQIAHFSFDVEWVRWEGTSVPLTGHQSTWELFGLSSTGGAAIETIEVVSDDYATADLGVDFSGLQPGIYVLKPEEHSGWSPLFFELSRTGSATAGEGDGPLDALGLSAAFRRSMAEAGETLSLDWSTDSPQLTSVLDVHVFDEAGRMHATHRHTAMSTSGTVDVELPATLGAWSDAMVRLTATGEHGTVEAVMLYLDALPEPTENLLMHLDPLRPAPGASTTVTLTVGESDLDLSWRWNVLESGALVGSGTGSSEDGSAAFSLILPSREFGTLILDVQAWDENGVSYTATEVLDVRPLVELTVEAPFQTHAGEPMDVFWALNAREQVRGDEVVEVRFVLANWNWDTEVEQTLLVEDALSGSMTIALDESLPPGSYSMGVVVTTRGGQAYSSSSLLSVEPPRATLSFGDTDLASWEDIGTYGYNAALVLGLIGAYVLSYRSRNQRTREAADEDDESEAFTEADLFPMPLMPEGPAQPVPEPAVVDDGHPDVWVEPTNVDPSGSQWLEYPSGSDRWYYRYADGEPWIDYNG